jgi:hypothetical protein
LTMRGIRLFIFLPGRLLNPVLKRDRQADSSSGSRDPLLCHHEVRSTGGCSVGQHRWKRRARADPSHESMTAVPVHVSNKFAGKATNVIQTGAVYGDVRVDSDQTHWFWKIAGFVTVLSAIIVVTALVMYMSRHNATSKASARDKPVPTSTVSSSSPNSPKVHPVEVHTATTDAPDGNPAVVNGIKIAVDSIGFIRSDNGSVDCSGGGNGPGSGECRAVAGHTIGTTTFGTVDFSMIAPGMTCKASNVQIHDSVIMTEPGGSWARVVILSISPSKRDADKTQVAFQVSLGADGTPPQGPKVCVPS